VDKASEFYVDKLGFRLDTDGNTWAVQEIRNHVH